MNNNTLANLEALNRALIGFDTMFTTVRKYGNSPTTTNYPPHNVIKADENEYIIQVAVTGFIKSEIHVSVEDEVLIIRGESNTVGYDETQYIHRGLATRDFVKEFPLAEHMEVTGASIENGMLTVTVTRNIPETAKPKVIDIVEIR
jgi:molecular chaperone IbpA